MAYMILETFRWINQGSQFRSLWRFSMWEFVSDHHKCVTSSFPALTLTHTSHPVACSCWLPLEPLPQCDLSQGAVLTSPSSLSSVFLICAGTDSVLYLFLVTAFHDNALLILSQRTLFHITVFIAFIENLLDILSSHYQPLRNSITDTCLRMLYVQTYVCFKWETHKYIFF